jgi:tetratricopeptide (TPR) repeat protein
MTIEEPKGRKARPRPAAPTTPDPVEIAMEIAASGQTPADAAMAVLHANAALMREQIDVAREEANLSREQIGLARNERFRNRIRSIRDIAIAAVVVALIVAMGAMVWTASRTTGLVIQPFSVPPELVEDGLDGRAVAALFQDELIRLETATNSVRPPASFRNDWSEGVTVEIEAGGLSLTDVYTALTRWLGKETFISGGLSRTPDGLELVVRSSDGTVVTVQGRPGDQPETLMRQAAERVYEQTQPYRYSTYLGNQGNALPDGPERQDLRGRQRAILTRLLDSPSQIERVWAYNGLALIADSREDSIAILQSALEIDPEHPNVLYAMASTKAALGQAEASLGYTQRMVASLSNPINRAKVTERAQQAYVPEWTARLAELQGDHLQALELYTRLLNTNQQGLSRFRSDRVSTLIALHQPSALQSLIADDDLRALGNQAPRDERFSLRAAAAAELDQWQQAVAVLEAWQVETSETTLSPRIRVLTQASFAPRLAYYRGRAGDLAGAQALIAATPLDCYLCVRNRARIAELAGDRPAADRWSAEARRQGPSLPFAFAERGQMLMARGDPAGAIAFYEQAVERGPRWADPQKFWGDALMAQGDEAGAIRKYRAAADRAPQWGALHLAWGRALEAQGRRDQAREKYTEAASMDLSAADRTEVVRRLGAVNRGS